MSGSNLTPKKWERSQLVYPDIYLPEGLGLALAERAASEGISINELIARDVERFLQDHERQNAIAAPVTSEQRPVWDAPDMVRRVVPLPEATAKAIVRLAETLSISANDLIYDILSASVSKP